MPIAARATIGVAIIWAAVMIAAALVLKETPYFARLLPTFGGGAVGTVLVVNISLRKATRKP